ncbi:hypothetical protein ACOMHN_054865 [Nucella lapillus]
METQAFVSNSVTDGALFDWNLPSNYCNNFLRELDQEYDLAEAEKQAIESGSITPLVKQELKLLIQSRRLSQGKEEMRVRFGQPCSHQLTQAEEERRLRRKDQNKRAAKRFRENKKFRESTLHEEISLLEGKNEGLRDKVTELRRLKDDLLTHLFSHLVTCPSSPTPFMGPATITSTPQCTTTVTQSPPYSDGSDNTP